MIETNLIREARTATLACRDYSKKMVLQNCTDQLQNVFSRFTISCSREDMSELVGAWTRVVLALNDLPVKPAPIEEKLTG